MRAGVSLPPPIGEWTAWARAAGHILTEAINRCQRTDEEYEPPAATPAAGTRIILRDTNGVRYAITVSVGGALVVTAL